MPTISVVIRTYTEQRWDLLEKAVESVLHQELLPDQLVIVVDHNPSLLERVVRRWPEPPVVVTENLFSRGSSGAWNAGISRAGGDIVAFLDDDAVAEPIWLARLTGPYGQADVVGVGGLIRPNWQTKRPGWFPEEFGWVVGCSYRGLPKKVAPVRNLIGCNMSFRRSVLKDVGGFLEGEGLGHMGALPVGCDETEISIRIGQQWPNALLLHNPSARVLHLVPPARAKFGYFISRCRLEGRSKAIVAEMVGDDIGLQSERGHALHVLPGGVLRGLRAAFLRADIGGIGRAGAICVGFGVTAVSYLVESLKRRLAGPRPMNVAPAKDTPTTPG